MAKRRRTSLFEEIGGEGACRHLSAVFHDRILHDPELRPMFPRAMEPQEERLAWFLVQAFGGPPIYTAKRGKKSLVCRHAHLRIGPSEVEGWLGHMLAAVAQLDLPQATQCRLEGYFMSIAPSLGDPLLPYYDLSTSDLEALLGENPGLASISDQGRTLLLRAAGEWNLAKSNLLLNIGADAHACDLQGHDALYYAANARHLNREAEGVSVVELIIGYGGEVNRHSGPKRVTPLHMAARRGTVLIAQALIRAGADKGALDSSGATPLQRAINCRQAEMVALLT